MQISLLRGKIILTFDILKELVQERRSIRKYTDMSVSKKDIIDIIDCARYAPSDTNSQMWEFIVICDKKKIEDIANITKEALMTIANNTEKKGLVNEANMLVRSFSHYATAFYNAPVLIISLVIPYTSKFKEKMFDPIGIITNDDWEKEGIKSNAMACQNIMLAAHSKGLATCPFTGPILLANDLLREYLDIDSSKQLNMLISLGYPAESPKAPTRKTIEEVLTFL